MIPYPTTQNLAAYLAATAIIDHATPAVSTLAQQLTAPLTQDVDQVRCLFEWVRDRIPHTSDINAEIVTCSASEVLAAGTGLCFAKSHLLAALLRAVGIPAGFCYQVCADDDFAAGTVLHGLNGVYLQSCDRWLRLDPRGNTGTINAQFDLTQEQLAFPPDPTHGEFIYPQIWPCPCPEIATLLTQFNNRSILWPHLPAALPDGYATNA